MQQQQQRHEQGHPEATDVDRDCAFYVRDALFPLRRDWGNSRHLHGSIHPALDALDRLRADLIEKRPKSTSYSNVFPRGVLLVPRTDAMDATASSNGNNNSNEKQRQKLNAMEYNGQPDVDEYTATVEVVPDLLTVRCMKCNGGPEGRRSLLPASSRAFVRSSNSSTNGSWQNPNHQELVLCSDRVLQSDYYRNKPGSHGQHRREDPPVRSMKAVEETLAREITRFFVHGDDGESSSTATATTPSKTPIERPIFPSGQSSPEEAASSCDHYARLEVLAARAAECLLKKDPHTGEVRTGSALRPRALFPVLPSGIQNTFVDRCVWSVASRHTLEEAKKEKRNNGYNKHLRPRDCLRRAWEDLRAEE